MLPALALVVVAGLEPTLVSPCIDEVTVRDGPSVKAKRVGVLPRGAQVVLLGQSEQPDTLTLTIDRNVPAPFEVKLEDAWLEVQLPTDAGAGRGWVFGGLMCRQAFPEAERWLTVLGWSTDGTKVAFIERATDSFACGWGRPATLRLVDVVTGRQLDSLDDGCPAADLFLARRAEVQALLLKHGVRTGWHVVRPAGSMPKAEVSGCRKGVCVLRLVDAEGRLRAEAPVALPEGRARATTVLFVATGSEQVAFVRLRVSDEVHRFVALRLGQPRAGAVEAWRDALPGVHFTTADAVCGSLAATTKDDAAKTALSTLEADLRRRVKRVFGSDGLCVVGALLEGRALVLHLVGQACVGAECPAGPCKTKLALTIGPDFTVRQERRLRSEGWSCDP